MSQQRKSFIARLLSGEFTLPTSVESDDVEKDRRNFYQLLRRENKTDEIGVSTEKGRGLIWFFKRKKNDGT